MDYFKKSIWKWILLYLAIAAVAYGVVYYFFFYKNYNSYDNQRNLNSETADWKTYINTKYGYEFRYPNNWHPNNLEKVEKTDSEIASFTRPFDENNLSNDPAGDTVFSIWVPKELYIDSGDGASDLKEEKDVNKYFIWLKDQIKKDKNTTYYQEIDFHGYAAIYYLHKDDVGGLIIYDFIKDSDYYSLSTGYKKYTDDVGKKILSTFKFTK